MSIARERDGAILVVTIDRPRAANAINPDVGTGFCIALREAAGDPTVGAVILTGAGERVFSAGADLKNPDNLPPAELSQLRARALSDMLFAMLDFPKPLVAAVNGVAAGAGMMLAMLADQVVVASTARFVLPEIDVGIPTFLGLAIVADLAGSALAADLVQTGRSLPAEEAARRGLAMSVHPAELRGTALRLARLLAGKDQAAFAQNKAWVQGNRRTAIARAIAHAQAARSGG